MSSKGGGGERVSMEMNQTITRRETLKRLLQISAGMALGRLSRWPLNILGPTAFAETKERGFLVEGTGQTKGYVIKDLIRNVFDAAGGISRFISRGDIVVIKPNISWARRPDLGATTHPGVMEAVIELCQEAGAKKIRITDNTIHDARRCFAITGAGQVAKKTGADLVYPRSSLMKEMKIRGKRLDVWPVFAPIVEADRLINLPIAKRHSLTTLTLGMKNWIGAVGGSRWSLHQDIHQAIVDLAQFFHPTVTLIDATTIMTRNGPSGGGVSDVVIKNTLILSNDPVAADASASGLFGVRPTDVGFIRLGQKWGLGTMELDQLDRKKVIL
jgi:uncharacterized protein (DUF362 family)